MSRFLYSAVFLSGLSLGGFLWMARDSFQIEVDRAVLMYGQNAVYAVAIAIYFLLPWIRSRICSDSIEKAPGPDPDMETARKLFLRDVVTAALLDVPVTLGAVWTFLSGHPNYFYLLAAVSTYFAFKYFPR